MMQAANQGQFEDIALVGRFDRARLRTIRRQRTVRSMAMIIIDILSEPTSQVSLVEHNHAV